MPGDCPRGVGWCRLAVFEVCKHFLDLACHAIPWLAFHPDLLTALGHVPDKALNDCHEHFVCGTETALLFHFLQHQQIFGRKLKVEAAAVVGLLFCLALALWLCLLFHLCLFVWLYSHVLGC